MYQRTALPNGIRIVSEYIPHVRSVSVGLWFETGSAYESWSERGYSHFIEHLMFKGTRSYSAREISQIIEQSGGQLNAFTGKEHTCYYAQVLDEEFATACDVLKEMLLASTFSPLEIDKERGVLLEEIKMAQDFPADLVHDLLCQSLWPDHPLGRDTLGSVETILQADRDSILDFFHTHHTADALVIAVAGNITHDQIVDQLAKAFSTLPRSCSSALQRPETAAAKRIAEDKDTEQVNLCLGGEALSRHDTRKYALYLLDTITGGGASSRLFQELREERGLVYSTYSYHSSFRHTGNFGVYAGCSLEHMEQVIEIIAEQLVSLAEQPLDPAEVERCKGLLKGSLLLSLESTPNRMMRLAKGELNFGRIISHDETTAAIDAVSLDELQSLAKILYQPEQWNIVSIGPTASCEARARGII